jgi:cation:H+ antiporter
MILLVCFGLFMWYSFHRDRKAGKTEGEAPAEEDRTPFWLAVVKVVGGLAVLITSCDFFVDNAVLIAKSFGVNDAFISLTLIACGTSLPELAASVAAALKKNTQLALGNVIGSNIFNITWILGLSSQVMPLNSSGITGADYCVMVAAALLPVIIGFKGKIGRAGGALLFIGFLAYNWYLISNQIV